MKKSRNILSLEELRFVMRHKFSIRSCWISPEEGVEYSVHPMGGDRLSALHYCKSARAAYNFIVRRCKR